MGGNDGNPCSIDCLPLLQSDYTNTFSYQRFYWNNIIFVRVVAHRKVMNGFMM